MADLEKWYYGIDVVGEFSSKSDVSQLATSDYGSPSSNGKKIIDVILSSVSSLSIRSKEEDLTTISAGTSREFYAEVNYRASLDWSMTPEINSLYEKYEDLNPFSLSKKLNIEIKFVPFKDRPYGNVKIIFGEPIIFINMSKENEHFFICAHELYHAIAHKQLRYNYQTNIVAKAKMEIEANLFASHLIMNDYLLKYKTPPKNFLKLQTVYGLFDEMKDFF